jgi:two-component system sensor histidine kinase VicK
VQVGCRQVSTPEAEAPGRDGDRASRDELQDINGRLLIAGLKAEEQADVQITLRGEAEAALTVRDEFISIAAHELRTPVTRIKLSAELAHQMLEDATPDLERIDQYLLGIVGGANRLVSLISDLMDVSQMRSGELLVHLLPTDLVVLVNTVVERYAKAGSEHHQVTTDLPGAPLIVAGDVVRLDQVLDNLLGNAIKYSPDGGQIGVTLREALNGIVMTVSDAGIGLPPGTEERIFEPFARADNARQQALPGMGLGLHICRQIAAAHGGRMWALSDGEGRGMTVGMWLPSVSTPDEAVGRGNANRSRPSLGQCMDVLTRWR